MAVGNSQSKTATISQSNALIQASYQLTLAEKRTIIAAISKIDSRKSVPTSVTITAEEYAGLFDTHVKTAYKQLKSGAHSLYGRTIKINTPDKSVDDETRWIYRRAIYHTGEGKVTLHFSPTITPYLGELSAQFTSYKLMHVKKLGSVHSIRIYELLMQYEATGQRWITVDQFREVLDLEDKYPNFSDLKRWILNPAKKELSAKSNYNVNFQEERKGRKVHKIWFDFVEKPQLSMDF
ncbi:MAG: replication initiation protein [Legionellaceae bacterium]|nr:replication initiation protein [Legionellaceae bacterium]